MEIVFVSTYPPQACGIAEYTYDLAHALQARGHSVTVLAETRYGADNTLDHGIPVYRLWDRRSAYTAPFGLKSVLQAVAGSRRKPDVVHIQHEFGLFPSTESLTEFTTGIVAQGIAVVATLHTVLPEPLALPLTSRAIVHTASQAHLLMSRWKEDIALGPQTYHLIPHGVRVLPPAPIGERLVCPGFISPAKNHDEILRALALSRTDMSLLIVGDVIDGNYLHDLEQAVRSYGLESRVEIQPGYMHRDQLRDALAQASAIVLGGKTPTPSKPASHSASGQVHGALGLGKIVIAKNIPIYQDGATVIYDDDLSLTAIFRGFARMSGAILRELGVRSALLGQSRSWERVAKMHEDVYAK